MLELGPLAQGQEAHLSPAQEGERVEVGGTAQQPPVQTRAPRAVAWFVGDDTDGVGVHRVTAGHVGIHR